MNREKQPTETEKWPQMQRRDTQVTKLEEERSFKKEGKQMKK